MRPYSGRVKWNIISLKEMTDKEKRDKPEWCSNALYRSLKILGEIPTSNSSTNDINLSFKHSCCWPQHSKYRQCKISWHPRILLPNTIIFTMQFLRHNLTIILSKHQKHHNWHIIHKKPNCQTRKHPKQTHVPRKCIRGNPNYTHSKFHTVPIHNKDPHNHTNHQKNKTHHQNSVHQRKSITARSFDSASNEQVNIEENRDDNKERNRSVDKVFGVMLE